MNTEKIYFGENLLLLSENDKPENPKWEVRLYDPIDADLLNLIGQLQKRNIEKALLVSGDFDALIKKVAKHFKIVKAGGGIVFDNNGRVLLIFRRGKWDLPKGKLDEGETIEECALREVSEETGLVHISIRNFFGITRHVYEEKGELILKETHWYVMDYRGNEELTPQAEEDIEDAVWVVPEKLGSYLTNTYPSIIEIFRLWK